MRGEQRHTGDGEAEAGDLAEQHAGAEQYEVQDEDDHGNAGLDDGGIDGRGVLQGRVEKHVKGEDRTPGSNLIQQKAHQMANVIIDNGLNGVNDVWGSEINLYYLINISITNFSWTIRSLI